MLPARHLLAPAVLSALLLSGCLDPITSPFDAYEAKLRHPQLLERAVRTDPAGKFGPWLGLLVRVRSRAHSHRWGIIERYRLVDRYELAPRQEFSEAFQGFSVEIRDTTGGADFTAMLNALRSDPDIEWLEPDFSLSTPRGTAESGRSGQRVPWSVALVGGRESSTVSGDGSGAVPVDVFVLDTGISNPDLDVVEALDFRPDHDDPGDRDGHGTHVAGIIGALDDTEGLVGVAPGARVHNLKVLGDDGQTQVSVVMEAVEYLLLRRLEHPARPMVVNLSLGEHIGTTEFTALDEAVERLVSLGAVVVVAAGNQSVDAAHVSPAHAPSVITVGAHDAQGRLASFSNFGRSLDLLAPGVGVISLAPSSDGAGAPVRMTGTSMAAPHVTGAAALYLSANPGSSPSAVLQALVGSARQGPPGSGPTTNLTLWVGDF